MSNNILKNQNIFFVFSVAGSVQSSMWQIVNVVVTHCDVFDTVWRLW